MSRWPSRFLVRILSNCIFVILLLTIIIDVFKWSRDNGNNEENEIEADDEEDFYYTPSIDFHQFYRRRQKEGDYFKQPGIAIAVENDTIQEEFEQQPLAKDRKLILIWNYYYKIGLLRAWRRVFAPITNEECPESRCQMTTNRSRVSEADAIIFHLPNLHWNNYKIPTFRPKNQLYILLTHESSLTILERTRSWGIFPFLKPWRLDGMGFNATMSVRSDSRIKAYMGHIERLDRKLSSYEVKRRYGLIRNRFSFENYSSESYVLRNDSRAPIVWFVSHCRTLSRREVIVKELQEYIGVDIYGRCGDYFCGYVRNFNVSGQTLKEDPCFHLANHYYRFQVAMENSFCKDYITEKVYHALNQHTIPIVAFRKPDLERLPPHSVINVLDFRSSRELAAHLYYLLGNETAFNEYFEWRRRFAAKTNYGAANPCDLCAKMHDPEFVDNVNVVNVTKWLVHQSDCVPAASSMLPKWWKKALI